MPTGNVIVNLEDSNALEKGLLLPSIKSIGKCVPSVVFIYFSSSNENQVNYW